MFRLSQDFVWSRKGQLTLSDHEHASSAGPVTATLGPCNGSGFHIALGAYGLNFWAS